MRRIAGLRLCFSIRRSPSFLRRLRVFAFNLQSKNVLASRFVLQLLCRAMSEKLVRKVAIAALKGEKVHAPEATDKQISLAIMEAAERRIVEASDLTSTESPHPEWMLIGPTGLTQRYLNESRTSKKLWAGAVTAI